MVSFMTRLVPSPLRRAGRHIGRRGIFLLFFSFLWMSTGFRWFVKPPPADNYTLMFRMMPPHHWGILFIVMATGMLLGALIKRLDPISYALSTWVASFLCVITTLGAFSLPLASAATAGSVAFTYLLYAVLVYAVSGWPEAHARKTTKDGN